MPATQFRLDCPHCGARQAAFTFDYYRETRQLQGSTFAMASCGVCDGPVLLHYLDSRIAMRGHAANVTNEVHDFPGAGFGILTMWPEDSTGLPDRLPAPVAAYFRQGVSNKSSKHWDAAGAMFRKSLDVGTKILAPDTAKLTLFNRIERLASDGRLTSDLAKWAHEVRIDGNEAVHSEEPETEEDVAALHEFCRAVLLYTFTLPALVSERHSSKKP